MSNSKDIGDETEAVILSRLLSAGFSVSIPFGDNDGYDLIIDDCGDLYRVQCKTAWHNSDQTIRFNTHSQTTKNGDYYESTYRGAIDAFLVRDPLYDELYWIDIADTSQQKMDLRFDADIDHPSINWASEFRFTDQIP